MKQILLPSNLLAILALIVTFAVPAIAGGPVIVTEEAPIADTRPQGDGGNWVVPVAIGLVILCAIACGGDDAPATTPDPGCYRKCK
mgnify:CR=1 FL=1